MAATAPSPPASPTVAFDPDPAHRGWRALYLLTTTCLSVLMVAAVVDGVSKVPVFGVDARWTGTSGGDYYLALLQQAQQAEAAGFDEVHLGQIGGDQSRFLDFFRAELAPQL